MSDNLAIAVGFILFGWIGGIAIGMSIEREDSAAYGYKVEKPEPDATHVYKDKTCYEYFRFNELGFRDNVLVCVAIDM